MYQAPQPNQQMQYANGYNNGVSNGQPQPQPAVHFQQNMNYPQLGQGVHFRDHGGFAGSPMAGSSPSMGGHLGDKLERPQALYKLMANQAQVEPRNQYARFNLDASPVTFRVTCFTNRSTVADLNSPTKSRVTTAAPDNPFLLQTKKYPFTPGQRLVVKELVNMRVREEGTPENNPVVDVLKIGMLVYFIRGGKDGNRIKVQSMGGKQGWTSWISTTTDDPKPILEIYAQEV